MDLRNVRSREPSQALLGLYNFTLIRSTTMSYTGNSKFYWQNTWFADVTVLRGGIFAMKR
ncbi:hypothetical protein AWJ07_06490 [Shewanella frigidimarina]|jgi:hypothetical protein|uniref:Uncharacterized protein n=2 Tax=Shewanella frigidimarina TaxID=56812 RepID=Q086J8_SHEFN|nr:hypothetical protein Sfri_0964 [Shewanella frigidimarina NCIMB 400]KVX01098.1 hypothetical protein AWJ07_06490 [Shewanella frigidimarina]